MAERKLFGTDGIRGVANVYPMTAEIAVRLGQAIAWRFRQERDHTTRILIGKDTRISGYMFESSLAAGITSMGADVMLVGPLPTPAISFLATSMRADAGIVISASHNAYRDNGIKIFGRDGFKLPDEEELELERYIFSAEPALIDAEHIGKAMRIDDASGRYIVFLKHTFPKDLTLDGVRIVLDCANGAAYKVAPTALRELGAEVITIGTSPDGRNINLECGSTFPDAVSRRVLETRADVGIALDGDADRVMMIDECGRVIDGDKIIALCAISLKNEGVLGKDTVVATIMSNIGLEVALKEHGIKLVRSAVGDRYVVEKMREGGFNLGGEQSGHIIFGDHTTTGDGMIAALQVLAIMQRQRRPLSKVSEVMTAFPQILRNIKVKEKPPLETIDEFQVALRDVEAQLGERGRVVARYSGTEPKARVMVEGPDEPSIRRYADTLIDSLRAAIGA